MPRIHSERERLNEERYKASLVRAGAKKAQSQRTFRLAAGLDPETGLPVTAPAKTTPALAALPPFPAPVTLPEAPVALPPVEPTASTPSPLTTN